MEVDEALELLAGSPAACVHEAVAGCLAGYAATLKAMTGEEHKPEPMPV
jgi:hypothetical protein